MKQQPDLPEDELFFFASDTSLRRGKRRTPRTETCRPCLLWSEDVPEFAFQGIALNVTPYGLLIRMLETIPAGTHVMVQLMRDEEFRDPLAPPIKGIVVRIETDSEGFADHGIQLVRPAIPRAESPLYRTHRRQLPSAPPTRRPSRMHTLDFIIGDGGIRRTE